MSLENEGIEGRIFLVTGGLGTVGSALCFELARRGARQVRSLHLDLPLDSSSPLHASLRRAGVVLIHGDVRNKNDVDKAVRGADCVFHLASYGGSGKDMLQAGRVDDTNITGTCNVLDSCRLQVLEKSRGDPMGRGWSRVCRRVNWCLY